MRFLARPLTQCRTSAKRSGSGRFRLLRDSAAHIHQPVLSFLRLDWLGTDRVVGYSRAVALLYIPALVILLLIAAEVISIPADQKGTDFVSFWVAAKLVLAGGNPYDLSQLFALQGESLYAFFYPPPFLFPILPFGALPFGIALTVWAVLGTALAVLAIRPFSPSIWPVLAFPPLLVNAAHGQNGALTAALFFGAALTFEKRPFLAGLLLGCFIIKPHLALLFPVAFLAGRRWSVVAGGAVSASFWLAASFFAFGPDIWADFMAKGAEATAHMEHDTTLHPKFVSLFGMVRAPGGPLWASYGAQAIAALAAAICVAIAWKREDSAFAMSVLATGAVLATPFVYSYDLVLLLLPLCWLARDGLQRGFRPWVKLAMTVAFWTPLVDRILGISMGINPAFLANAGLMAALFWQRTGRQACHRTIDSDAGHEGEFMGNA